MLVWEWNLERIRRYEKVRSTYRYFDSKSGRRCINALMCGRPKMSERSKQACLSILGLSLCSPWFAYLNALETICKLTPCRLQYKLHIAYSISYSSTTGSIVIDTEDVGNKADS